MSSRDTLSGTDQVQFKNRTNHEDVQTTDVQANRGTPGHGSERDELLSSDMASHAFAPVQAKPAAGGGADRMEPWEADAGLLSAFGIKDVAPPQAHAHVEDDRIREWQPGCSGIRRAAQVPR